jgi:hypothetical protein
VCLTPGAEYAIKFPTGKLWLPGYKKTLKDVLGQPWTVHVSYTGTKRTTFDVIIEYPVEYSFWIGDIQASVVNAPKR